MFRYFIITGLALWLLGSCQPSVERAAAPSIPATFVPMVIPDDNPQTVAGIALGRQLFFDPILSLDGTVSCASCHRPERAFTDGGAVSIGVRGRQGMRSAPSLLNIGFHYKGMFWDGRSPSLEEQVLHPIVDSVEMAADWPTIAARLQAHPDYPAAFEAAFPGQGIQLDYFAKALAQYQRTLISVDSKYDQVQRGDATFTPQEKRGWTIFFDAGYPDVPMAECSHCHTDPLFTNLGFANNGLDASPTLEDFPDPGLGRVTGIKYDNGKFRVPTLRNIAVTAPYMHDGRFATLEQVIDHYNTGGHPADNADPNVRPLHLTPQDKADLIAFLHTLTDSTALRSFTEIDAGWKR